MVTKKPEIGGEKKQLYLLYGLRRQNRKAPKQVKIARLDGL
jgi:hypothetical protein